MSLKVIEEPVKKWQNIGGENLLVRQSKLQEQITGGKSTFTS